jgi:hypothetical protein
MMMRRRVIAPLCCILLGLALPVWNSGQSSAGQESQPIGTHNASTDLQIQSSVLRIDFDGKLRSRVVALLGSSPQFLTPFSDSETVTGNRIWSAFTLSGSHRERVSDAFGAGERLSLTGKSGDLRKDISVTIYADFPSIAVFDVTYKNEGSTQLMIRGWANQQYVLSSNPAAHGPAFWSYQSGSYEKRPNWVLPLRAAHCRRMAPRCRSSGRSCGAWTAPDIASCFHARRAACASGRALGQKANAETG